MPVYMGPGGPGPWVSQSANNSGIGVRNHNFVNAKVSAQEEEFEQLVEKLKKINLSELD